MNARSAPGAGDPELAAEEGGEGGDFHREERMPFDDGFSFEWG